MARILLVDDDPALLDVLSLTLSEAHHDVEVASNGVEGLLAVERARPQLAIVDVNMPRLDGLSMVRRLRTQGERLPILILTSRDDEVDEALGLELGADDWVAKPFSTRVLLARVQALLRRDEARTSATSAVPLILDALALDMERMEVSWQGAAIAVTVTELKMLEALARRPGIVHSRERLLDLARGDDSVVGDRLVDTYVRRLRRKLEAVDPGFDRIETVVGAGYRWRSGPAR